MKWKKLETQIHINHSDNVIKTTQKTETEGKHTKILIATLMVEIWVYFSSFLPSFLFFFPLFFPFISFSLPVFRNYRLYFVVYTVFYITSFGVQAGNRWHIQRSLKSRHKITLRGVSKVKEAPGDDKIQCLAIARSCIFRSEEGRGRNSFQK